MKKRLKINGIIMFIVILLIVIFPTLFFRYKHGGFFDEISEIFGIAFILLGQIFRVSARGYKSQHSGEGRALIQSGPYALVRNPMYLGILLIGLGIVLVLFKWWVAAIFLIAFIRRYLLLIFKEEKKLSAIFPQTYKDYQRKVPRLFPRLGMLLQRDVSEYLPLKSAWLKKEIGTILAILLITLFLESGKDIFEEGLGIYLKELIAIALTVTLFVCLVIYLSRRRGVATKDVSGKSKNSF